jgi:hypothetical protein
VAEQNPPWLNFLQGSTGRRRSNDPAYLGYRPQGTSGGPQPIEITAVRPTTLQEQRLAANPDLEKQVDRLRRAELQGEIVGADIERPRGLLGFVKSTAEAALEKGGEAIFGNPVIRGLAQAMSVINAAGKQLTNVVDVANENYNPLRWLADRMDEYNYGRV